MLRLKEIEQGILVSPWLDDALRAASVIGADGTRLSLQKVRIFRYTGVDSQGT